MWSQGGEEEELESRDGFWVYPLRLGNVSFLTSL